MNNELDPPDHIITLRKISINDLEALADVSKAAYQKFGNPAWSKSHLQRLLEVFPEGQICIEDHGRVVAFALSIIVDYAKFGDGHTYHEITDNFNFNSHDDSGDTLYGIEVCVHPEFRNLRLGRRLYDERKELCDKLNLRSIVAGGRMPNFYKYAETLKPREYIEKVKLKEIYDPVLSFQLSNGFHVRKVLTDYLPGDKESKAFATLIEWNNIYYTPPNRKISRQKSYVRLGLVQWQMRPMPSLDSLYENIEFFIDTVSAYNADFFLFPELFNVPLMAPYNASGPGTAIRKLADMTEDIRLKLVEFAVSYNINIIAGSMPYYDGDSLKNVAYLCRRNGTCDSQYKIHVTPSEVNDWGMVGGDTLKIFETDAGRIGILVCYDVEFPELPRLLAENGLEILFVPFSVDSQSGYQRVRKCAEARAIENECYVAITGSVGNLPKVRNMDVQFAQSSVFSPSDFAFPNHAIVAEATPNTETVVIADVDLELLKELHNHGSVRNLKDRRKDLFKLTCTSPVTISAMV